MDIKRAGKPRQLGYHGHMTTQDILREREKELACIYSICLLAANAPEPQTAAEGIARALCAAMQHESKASCTVTFRKLGSEEAISARRGEAIPGPASGCALMEADLPEEEALGWIGGVSVTYLDPALAFLPQERTLLDSVLVIAASILRTANLIARLRSASEDLSAKNIALREILSMIEEEKKRMLLAFREKMASEILPLAERSRDLSLTAERRAAYQDILVEELGRDIRSLGPGPELSPALSPREREIAIQVRNGRTSKEIAELLGIAEATVERHRHNIRRKLRVADRGINLASFLDNEASRPVGE
jgi:DNA-binding CsgD family transcriptional regulator